MKYSKNPRTKRTWEPDPDLFKNHPSALRAPVKQTRLYLDNEYFKEGYGAIFPHSVTAVYAVLVMHARHDTQICFPSAETIMRLTGITNRSTVFDAIKILEAYDIIAVSHSKGRAPNVYGMTEHYGWKPINSIDFETVRKGLKKKKTVTKISPQQLQKDSNNSGADDTRSHLIDSDNYEITPQAAGTEKQPLKGKQLLEGFSPMAKSVVTPCFREEDIIAALEEICADGTNVGKLGYKEVIRNLLQRGAVKTKELPTWINL